MTTRRFAPGAVLLLSASLAACSTSHRPRRGAETIDLSTGGSLDAVERRREVARASVEVWPDFTLGFVEFDDQGQFWAREQLTQLERTLEAEAARPGYDGVAIALYVHGWKHDASVCDDDVACWRAMLSSLAADVESVVAAAGGAVPRLRVVGVYAGWRGLSQTAQPLRSLSFWARKRAAERLGRGDLVDLLTRVDLFARRQEEERLGRARLVVLGHSFGGLAVYTALSNIFKTRAIDALSRARPGAEPGLVRGFGDLVVLVNPALEASAYLGLKRIVDEFSAFSPRQAPVLVTVASETDAPNSMWFPIGQSLATVFQKTSRSEERRALRVAVGNYAPLWDYRLTAAPGREDLVARDAGRMASRCACVLRHLPMTTEEIGDLLRLFPTDGRRPATNPFGVDRTRRKAMTLGRAAVAPLRADVDARNPFWVVRASDEVIHGHGGFQTPYFTDFLRRLILASANARAVRERSADH